MRKRVLCHMLRTKAQISLHPRSLISAFVVRCLNSVMSLVSATKISSLMLASVAEQASLSLTWSETHEDTFSHEASQINKSEKTCHCSLIPAFLYLYSKRKSFHNYSSKHACMIRA